MASTVNPYRDLYIYYLEGRLNQRDADFDNSFIGNWEEDGFTFLFFSRPADKTVEMTVKRQPHLKLLDHFQMTYDEWHGDALCALSVGNFLIESPWERTSEKNHANPEKHCILLDPGVVFGTGTHPTTRDCLCAMEAAFAEEMPKRAVDAGCGTGILALAAAKLGCALTLAVDLNFLCVQTTRKNIILNHLADRVLAIQCHAQAAVEFPVDFIISNIHYDIMKSLIEQDAFYANKRFILSGLMRKEAMAVQSRLLDSGARITRTWDQDGVWFTFSGSTGRL